MPEHRDPFDRRAAVFDAVGAAIIVVLFLGAVVATVGILARDVYSPSGLVNSYLGSLAKHDVNSALALPGAAPEDSDFPGVSRELLRSDLLGDIRNIKVVSDDEFGTGRHRVTATFEVDGKPARGFFMVEPVGPIAGIFTDWRFAELPFSLLEVTVEHSTTFSVDKHTLDTRVANPDYEPGSFNTSGRYLVFAPSVLKLGHSSDLLQAETQNLLVTPATSTFHAIVNAEPSDKLIAQVQLKVDEYLDSCTKQDVLMPAGCPFGTSIDNRVVSAPKWSISEYPKVELVAGSTSWVSNSLAGIAHIEVEVQSIYDGSVSKEKVDVPFRFSLESVILSPGNALTIQVGS